MPILASRGLLRRRKRSNVPGRLDVAPAVDRESAIQELSGMRIAENVPWFGGYQLQLARRLRDKLGLALGVNEVRYAQ